MYEHLSLHDVSPVKLSSSIWQQYFVEQEQWRQQITQPSIQLRHSMTQMHHPALHKWIVWRVFTWQLCSSGSLCSSHLLCSGSFKSTTFEMPLIVRFGAITTLYPTKSEFPITSNTVLHLDNDMKQRCIKHA